MNFYFKRLPECPDYQQSINLLNLISNSLDSSLRRIKLRARCIYKYIGW